MLDYEKEYQRNYYLKNREKLKNKSIEYYKKNKNNKEFIERKREIAKNHREKTKKIKEMSKEKAETKTEQKRRTTMYSVYLEDNLEFIGNIYEICEKYDWNYLYAKWLSSDYAHKKKNKYKPNRRVYKIEE